MDQKPVSIRERSGEVDLKDPMVVFFYVLMRDYLTPGSVEKIIQRNRIEEEGEIEFSNGWLAEYSKDIVRRLTS